jgi:cbb3-type cytochrome oxidase subunit 3
VVIFFFGVIFLVMIFLGVIFFLIVFGQQWPWQGLRP